MLIGSSNDNPAERSVTSSALTETPAASKESHVGSSMKTTSRSDCTWDATSPTMSR